MSDSWKADIVISYLKHKTHQEIWKNTEKIRWVEKSVTCYEICQYLGLDGFRDKPRSKNTKLDCDAKFRSLFRSNMLFITIELIKIFQKSFVLPFCSGDWASNVSPFIFFPCEDEILRLRHRVVRLWVGRHGVFICNPRTGGSVFVSETSPNR